MRITTTLLCMACLCVIARAGEMTAGASATMTPGVSVIGSATVKIRPSTVEISASLSADAELANDARVKERDARQRIADVLETKAPGVVIESKGIAVNPLVDQNVAALQRAQQQQIMIQNGVVVQVPMNQVDSVRRIGVTEQLRLVLKDADKLDTPKLVETVARMIDAAREGGLKFGSTDSSTSGYVSTTQSPAPSPMVICRAQDSAAVREEAYKAALEDARQKASKLAEISGVKIGKVVAIQELDNGTTSAQSTIVADKDSDLSSSLLGEIPVNVRLAVQFEIVK